jgi:hypothetical protein
VEAQVNGCATMCAYSCTYLAPDGYSSRDTDWYESFGTGVDVTLTGIADFPLQMILIYGTNCANLLYDFATSPAGVPVSLTHFIADGALVWQWFGPSVFNGVPNSLYTFEICGIQGGVIPTRTTSWGSLKSRYR